MTISELIKLLAGQQALHGDIEVCMPDPDGAGIAMDASMWTPDLFPHVTDYEFAEGGSRRLCLIIPHPQRIFTINEAGEKRNLVTGELMQ
jgi:hypothetical protein